MANGAFGGMAIVAAARSQIGTPYSFGGGGWQGKSRGIEQGANVEGYDCGGLAQYAVYKGTGKVIARSASEQYSDSQCKKMPYEARKPGDLVFFEAGGQIHHVGIVSGPNTMIHAPHSGDHVREASIYITAHVQKVARCF